MKGIIVEKDGTIRLADDIPMPEPGPYEALVKIESCMICNGTDMEIIRGELPEAQVFPTVLGHESAGRVVQIGEKVKAYLIRGARHLPGYDIWPNERVGYGSLCVSESLPLGSGREG